MREGSSSYPRQPTERFAKKDLMGGPNPLPTLDNPPIMGTQDKLDPLAALREKKPPRKLGRLIAISGPDHRTVSEQQAVEQAGPPADLMGGPNSRYGPEHIMGQKDPAHEGIISFSQQTGSVVDSSHSRSGGISPK